MTSKFDFLIVGRGMMGAAAARHLAESGAAVCLIGPDEPWDRSRHDGVFASHYDEGRITRRIDADPVWAKLAERSIERYRDIEEKSGIAFYREAGCLVVGTAQSSYLARTRSVAEQLSFDVRHCDEQDLASTFDFFAFPAGSEGVFEPKNAGHISPRRLVAAQSLLAERAGAEILRHQVVSIALEETGVAVTTSNGERRLADKVLVAAGSFSISEGLLPRRPEMQVFGRTVVLFEIAEEQAKDFAAMPSLILDAPGSDIYLLPPIRYPDGKLYLKIGGDPDDLPLTSQAALKDWFRGTGRPAARDHLERIARLLVPSMKPVSISTASCALSHTKSGYPMIGFDPSGRIGVATGCGGASAKSSDEIGRLASELMLQGRIVSPDYAEGLFEPAFA